jgi:Cytochrome b subunit of formate dehydrogenase
MIRRFERRHIVGHLIMMVTFIGLVITGFPQKFPSAAWAKGIVLIFGGVSRMRFVHHLLGTIMALQLVYHVLELLWFQWVRRYPWTMIPTLEDARDFIGQIRYNLGLSSSEPQYDRYSWPEKLEYLSLVWGTLLMVGTGIMMLYPIRFAQFVPGQIILAAKAAHGGEATLAALAILTWHSYFVHWKHWNTSIFAGKLPRELYIEEHPKEFARMWGGQTWQPAEISTRKFLAFVAIATVVVLACIGFVIWLRAVPVVLKTVRP